MSLSAPEPIADRHDLDSFDSGVASLDDWLRRRARSNHASGAARVFVVCDEDHVVAYYALASGSIAATDAGGFFRRNMPDPIPVVILGRLAVDKALRGRGLGRGLVRDAARRVLAAADLIGVRGMIVHAINEKAGAFYRALGFRGSPIDPLTLMITLKDLQGSL